MAVDTSTHNTDQLHSLSDYELQRLERIRKNEAYLERLGLGPTKKKLMDMTRKTKKNLERTIVAKRNTVNSPPARRSKRLKVGPNNKNSTNNNNKLVMLSYTGRDDDELTVEQQDAEYKHGEEDEDERIMSPRSRTRRFTIAREDFELSAEEKKALSRNMDENYLHKFQVGDWKCDIP
jgi:hypothetical protein